MQVNALIMHLLGPNTHRISGQNRVFFRQSDLYRLLCPFARFITIPLKTFFYFPFSYFSTRTPSAFWGLCFVETNDAITSIIFLKQKPQNMPENMSKGKERVQKTRLYGIAITGFRILSEIGRIRKVVRPGLRSKEEKIKQNQYSYLINIFHFITIFNKNCFLTSWMDPGKANHTPIQNFAFVAHKNKL